MATPRKPMDNRELLRMIPGADPVVTCYLKLESRDRTRQKYLTKVKNRVKAMEYALPSFGWDKERQEQIRGDLRRIVDYLSDRRAPAGHAGSGRVRLARRWVSSRSARCRACIAPGS